MDSGKDIREAVIKYSDTLYKVCIVILCNEHDVQDAIQDTFCRYLEKKPEFRDEEHEKAWLIRVATNICRDMIRFRIRHPKVSIDEVENTLAAPFVLAAGVVSFPVRAFVASVVQERMESVSEEEMKGLNDMVQSQHDVLADGFSREYSDSEKERNKALWQAYKNGTFPEKVIAQADSVEDAPEGTLCYIRATGVFNLPAQEMTDEEMLQIIDFQHKMSYAVAHGPQVQAAAAEAREKTVRLEKAVQDANGISRDEAVEIAKKQLMADLGDKADELELMTYNDGTPGVGLLDASDYSEVEFASESKAGVIYDVGFGNPDTHATYGYIIDAVDGSILYTYK